MSREEIKLAPPLRMDEQNVSVFDFEPLWDRRHVFKHVLDPAQQWSAYYGSINLAALRNQLVQVGCKGYRGEEEDGENMHGSSCANFAQCDAALGNLYPTYRNLILEGIREGAYEKAPRHTHNGGRIQTMSGEGKWLSPTNYFLSDKGVLAETYEDLGRGALCFKTAYRVRPPGRRPPGGQWKDSHFVRAAQEEVCIGHKRLMVRAYHTKQRWCGS